VSEEKRRTNQSKAACVRRAAYLALRAYLLYQVGEVLPVAYARRRPRQPEREREEMIHAHNGGGREEVGVVVRSVGWVGGGGTRSAHRAQGVRHSMGIQNALPAARLPRFISLFLSNSPPRVCCFHIAAAAAGEMRVLLFVLPALPLI